MKRGALLESVAFFEVIKVCITRELDTDIHRSCRELERISHRGFVGKFVCSEPPRLQSASLSSRPLAKRQRLYTAYMAEEAS